MGTVGLDFGTSTTMVATAGRPVTLAPDRAREWIPSLVGYDSDGALVAGIRAETAGIALRSIKKAITAKQHMVRIEPGKASGRLRVVSRNGATIRATLGDKSLDRFKVAISEQRFEFSIYPNGRIRLVDAAGTHEGQLNDWHTV